MAAETLESSPRLVRWFDDYSASHCVAGNQLCHLMGIPLIVWSILGAGAHVLLPGGEWLTALSPFLQLDLGIVIWFCATLWYLSLDWRLGLPFSLFLLGVYWLGRATSPALLGTAFVVGWGIQYLGHIRYERNRPAFYRNLAHLLIGPLWIFAKQTGYFSEK